MVLTAQTKQCIALATALALRRLLIIGNKPGKLQARMNINQANREI